MKKIALSAFAVIFGMLLLTSCGKDVEKQVVGKWKIETADLSNLEELVKTMAEQFGMAPEDLEDMKKELKDGMAGEFVGETIEFREDKTVSLGGSDEGTWAYDKEKNIITITQGDDKFNLEVKEISDKKFVTNMVFSDSGMDFQIAMTLAKAE